MTELRGAHFKLSLYDGKIKQADYQISPRSLTIRDCSIQELIERLNDIDIGAAQNGLVASVVDCCIEISCATAEDKANAIMFAEKQNLEELYKEKSFCEKNIKDITSKLDKTNFTIRVLEDKAKVRTTLESSILDKFVGLCETKSFQSNVAKEESILVAEEVRLDV